ncbi:MAG: hypothetical protein OEQ25_15475 [Gammaproteobacteria bacterium]|nr:hypothetical protein [Gammaproteobacteria bacterium]MDH3508534.1 hypothetical protein [Gammaproteobacteria bacterium]
MILGLNKSEFIGAFYRDGSLRDIYVLDVAAKDWSIFISWCRLNYPLDFFVDGNSAELPSEIEMIWDLRDKQTVRLGLSVGGLLLNCHFFSKHEIELDLSPNDVEFGEDDLKVLQFMKNLGDSLGKRVCLTPENPTDAWSEAHLRYQPTSSMIDVHRLGPIL